MTDSAQPAASETRAPAGFEIRPLVPADKAWVRGVLNRYWASPRQVTRGKLRHADELPGFAAFRGEEAVGLITYEIVGDECEIITHNSLADDGGIGSCLLADLRTHARAQGCRRLWLVTSNDNTLAMKFYQRRDFDMIAVHRDAIADNRKLKPEMPEVGMFGIRVKHEIEMEYSL
ncbi:MAG: ribosomal protein S18 acetylase RimI-like enzyme [Phycisphaerales bacterium]|jgi:ribosomal protein S18 acetylase RimI-like enzyme